MRTIIDVYENYKIPPTLQMHMLRVASVAAMICDHWQGEAVDKNKIVTVCLLHDMGNILKFKFDVFPEMFEPEGVEYWQNIQEEYRTKYGDNEHHATIQIIHELGLAEEIGALADQNHFSLLCEHAASDDILVKIMHHADMRVDPFGIVSYEARMEEGRKRYAGRSGYDELGRQHLVDCGKEIENQIFAKCDIKPEDINDTTAAPYIEELKNFVI